MQLDYETDRLILRVLHESSAAEVLKFYKKNREIFEIWEPIQSEDFYTVEHQAAILRLEFQLVVKRMAVRFWIFSKDYPDEIVGTVSFQNILRSIYQSGMIGYKLDPFYWKKGYATEALEKAISVVFQEFDLHRIEALVLPQNTASIRLLKRLGFEEEGIRRSCIYLHSKWTDHLQYSLIR